MRLSLVRDMSTATSADPHTLTGAFILHTGCYPQTAPPDAEPTSLLYLASTPRW